ncbi:PVC-type heme-binding CxxCH protein [Algoriphagus zhangzhouensis]|uniref:Putative membrane-bound dehydrogenase domain-containing protein n=1 Tax=Algoriphagus zhangzhouensis TaxID=1073327 RepID=A0A1M7ZBD5_9BACT|nr:PVC-type heme-binding CxxCH protein [Algoriphagus zhangzhouensis]TDY47045.1 putative membrane-bound dehydrogenase-like protein [Algoriphagus zhangzhouensis]SHO61996.1 putative membrane-bound dehydrogenase domain-containing protein [Algoriphagus zhangzhouensis]
MKNGLPLLLMLFLIFSCQAPQRSEEEYDPDSFVDPELFKDHIRVTDYQTPEEEMAGFHLPPGFEINLYASEPDITKPINMEFDDKGRLWVTHSIEYPYEASTGSGTDKITILEDTNGDGKADKFIDFASDLNIPIGIMPVKGGAIAYSIPNIYFFEDQDGDDRYDEKKVLLGPFGHEDTHGMINNFMRGLDGWIHASHGFRNTSHIAGADGDSIHMTSGNTFRFKIDGSRVEQTTYGRVNPFGYAVDDLGYIYSADCHSMPIYQIINQGDYPHFGKKAPGLGFGPQMMDYQIGSTALSGLEYYNGLDFPEEYRNSFYSGDVVACRVSRNSVDYVGSTPQAIREKDFLVSEDPWFRPVDIKIGPDGALYIADFYNRIIGHYEVPLDHPGRDRKSGRIWRITYQGDAGEKVDWSQATIDQLIEGLGSEIFHHRMLATDRLVDFEGEKAIAPMKAILADPNAKPKQKVHALWALKRLDALTFPELRHAAESESQEVRVHTYRVLAEYPELDPEKENLALNGLQYPDPHTQRAAADVLVKHPSKLNIQFLVATILKTPEADSHLKYTLLIGLRDHLKNPEILQSAIGRDWQDSEKLVLMDAMTDVPSRVASEFIFSNLKELEVSHDRMLGYMGHVGRFVPESQLGQVISFIQEKFDGDPAGQYALYQTIQTGIGQRGGNPNSPAMKKWALSFAGGFLENLDQKPTPVADKPSAHADEEYEYFEEVARQQIFAAQLASENKLSSYESGLRDLLAADWAKNRPRAMGAKALLDINPNGNKEQVESILLDSDSNLGLRQEIARNIGNSSYSGTQEMLFEALPTAPSSLQVAIASVLVNSNQGRNQLLKLAKDGDISPRILLDRGVNEQLLANMSPAQTRDYVALTSGMESVLEERQQLIDARLARFVPKPDLENGKAMFINTCTICHQIEGDGGIIGPQLDGIGNWGRRALTEKILDPNRNISQAFKTYTVTLKDGKVQSGLFRRDEGELEVYADASGQEFTVSKDLIQEKKVSQYTLMPDSFGESISEEDFDDLIAYLLTQK